MIPCFFAVVEKEMTLDVLCADLVLADVKAALATQYTVDAALIKLSDPCARRRLSGETESSSKDITVTMFRDAHKEEYDNKDWFFILEDVAANGKRKPVAQGRCCSVQLLYKF